MSADAARGLWWIGYLLTITATFVFAVAVVPAIYSETTDVPQLLEMSLFVTGGLLLFAVLTGGAGYWFFQKERTQPQGSRDSSRAGAPMPVRAAPRPTESVTGTTDVDGEHLVRGTGALNPEEPPAPNPQERRETILDDDRAR